nr:toprim domain-containing protein [uncultured Carboxylicivirga sp.]
MGAICEHLLRSVSLVPDVAQVALVAPVPNVSLKIINMNIQQAKGIPIVQYLCSLGLKPVRISNNNYWYKSMLRHENNASFKVDAKQNCWFDHGHGMGGNILDLVMKIYNLKSISEVLKMLSEQHSSISFSFHQQNTIVNKPDVRMKKVKNLQNKALLDYLKIVRRLNHEVAQRYCCEVYYQVNGKKYFAIGFKNEMDGYELRNKYFKGCFGSKDITIIDNNKDECIAFEGFIDFLSFIQLFPRKEIQFDYLILNSTSLVKEAIDRVKRYSSIRTFFDNDLSGKLASQSFHDNLNSIDCSDFYKQYNDVNSYLKSLKV